MAGNNFSSKRIQIDKANAIMVGAVAGAAFVVAFTLVASKALLAKRSFQAKVITAKVTADNQLKANVKAANSLADAYKTFIETPDNLIGGDPAGKGDRDGDNGKIVLDALPSKYDYPALTSSMEKLIASQGLQVTSITGTDDEATEGASGASTNPEPKEMPVSLDVKGPYDNVQKAIGMFELSIRPIRVKTFTLSGTNSEIEAKMVLVSYYQQARSLKVEKKGIK